MFLKVTASHVSNHRCLAQKMIQSDSTIGWQPKYFVQTFTSSSLHRQTACPLNLVWLKHRNQTSSYQFSLSPRTASLFCQRLTFKYKIIYFSDYLVAINKKGKGREKHPAWERWWEPEMSQMWEVRTNTYQIIWQNQPWIYFCKW